MIAVPVKMEKIRAECFSFKADNVEFFTINVTDMEKFLRLPAALEAQKRGLVGYVRLPVDDNTLSAVKTNGLERWRIDRHTELSALKPAFIVQTEKGVSVIVDGNHRLMKLQQLGYTEAVAVLFKYPVWLQFLVAVPEELVDWHGESGLL